MPIPIAFHRIQVAVGRGLVTHELTNATIFPRIDVYAWEHRLPLTQLHQLLTENIFSLSEMDSECTSQSPKRTIERLSIRIMLHHLFGKSIQLVYDKNGCPYLQGLKSNAPYISISHSAGLYALSLSPSRHGLDYEAWSEKAFRVRDKFLQDREQQILFEPFPGLFPPTLSIAQRATLLWSAKEAAYKYINAPSISLHSGISLYVKGNQPRLLARVEGQESHKHILIDLFADGSYAGAICQSA